MGVPMAAMQVFARVHAAETGGAGGVSSISANSMGNSVQVQGASATVLDGVLSASHSQRQTFELVARQELSNAISGAGDWVCVCYGPSRGRACQRSLFGDLQDEEESGLLPRSIHHVYQCMAGAEGELGVALSAAYVHEDHVTDLLDPSERHLRVVDGQTTGAYVNGITAMYASSAEGAVDILAACWSQRMSLQTDAYGHTFVTLCVRRGGGGAAGGVTTKVTFVELGGSELARASGARSKINRGT